MPIAEIQQPQYIKIDDDLRLRKFDRIVDHAFWWYQDEETVYLVDGVKKRYDRETLENMYRYLDAHGELYYIEVWGGEDYSPIGDVTFWQTDMPIVIGNANYRGKGIGLRVIQALVRRGRELGYDRLWVNEIYHHNIASRKCFEKAGFTVCESRDTGVRMMLEVK